MCIVLCDSSRPPLPFHGIRDESILIQSCVPCTALIIIFIDEYHCRQDDEVAICIQRLSHANTELGLCHCRQIWVCTDLCPLCLSNLRHAHVHTVCLGLLLCSYKSIFTSFQFPLIVFVFSGCLVRTNALMSPYKI